MEIRNIGEQHVAQAAQIVADAWHDDEGERAYHLGTKELLIHLEHSNHGLVATEGDKVLGVLLLAGPAGCSHDEGLDAACRAARELLSSDELGIECPDDDALVLVYEEEELIEQVDEELGREKVGVIALVIVSSEARGKGIARTLLQRGISWVREQGGEEVRLVTSDDCDWTIYEHWNMRRVKEIESQTQDDFGVYVYQGLPDLGGKEEPACGRSVKEGRAMRTDDFDYDLPDELIAQAPAEPRDSCKLLVLDREDGHVEHRVFSDIIDYLEPGDLVVVNRTRVMPARLIGRKEGTGGVAETLLLTRREDIDPLGSTWECLVNPGKRLRQGARIEYRAGGLLAPEGAPVVLHAEVIDFVEGSRGGRLVRFTPEGDRTLDEAVHAAGHVPLPPYIQGYEGDPEKYQTVYAMHEEHSAAAPTAGLHFTPELIERIREKGVRWAEVELEVGIDTFRLVMEDDPRDHTIHTERYHVSQEVVDAVHETKAAGHRVIAIGTTSVRSLESAFEAEAPLSEPAMVARRFERADDSAAVLGKGDVVARENATTSLYLMPGSTFHVVDAMVTNFHVPRSTLMMLVSAFATREQIMAAYEEAIKERYRFFSFGDAMLIV